MMGDLFETFSHHQFNPLYEISQKQSLKPTVWTFVKSEMLLGFVKIHKLSFYLCVLGMGDEMMLLGFNCKSQTLQQSRYLLFVILMR